MPRIPQYRRTETIPATSGNALRAPQDYTGAALAGIGNAIVNIGEVAAYRYKRIQDQQDSIILAKETSIMQEAATKKGLEFFKKTGSDTFGLQDEVDVFGKNLESLARKNPNKRISEPLAVNARNIVESMRVSVGEHQLKQAKITYEHELTNRFNTAGESVFHRTMPLPNAIKSIHDFIDGQEKLDIIDNERAIELKQNAKNTLAERSIAGWLTDEPEMAKQFIEEGYYDDYLSSADKQKYLKLTEREVEIKNEKRIANENERLEASIREVEGKLSDAMLVGDDKLFMSVLGENKQDLVEGGKYEHWIDKRTRMFRNAGTVSDSVNLANEAELFAESQKGIYTDKDYEVYRDKVLKMLGENKLTKKTAEGLLKDAKETLIGDPAIRNDMRQAVDVVDGMEKNGMLGKGVKGLFEKQRVLNTIMEFKKQHPGESVVDWLEKKYIPEKKSHWIKNLISGLSGAAIPAYQYLTSDDKEPELNKDKTPGTAEDYLKLIE